MSVDLVGTYGATRESFDDFQDNIRAEFDRLDRKDGITEEEDKYLHQLQHVLRLLPLIEELVFTGPDYP